jgi:hypothetical protein
MIEQASPISPTESLQPFIIYVPLKTLLRNLRTQQQAFHCQQKDDEAYFLDSAPGDCVEVLHLNLGTPGIEEPINPIEENLHVLESAIRQGKKSVPVLFSGDLKRAVEQGYISDRILTRLTQRLLANETSLLGFEF